MATTQNAGGNKRGRKSAADKAALNDAALKKLDEGKEPQAPAPEIAPEAPRSDEAKNDKRFLAVSQGSCLTAMQKAFGFGKAALNLEIAVSLAIFAFSEGGANKEGKRIVMETYAQAGYETDTDGEDYKTCNRRMNAAAKLYDFMTRREVVAAMDGRTEGDAIEALKNYLTQEYNFSTINSILAAVGQPVKQTNTAAYREKKAQDDAAKATAGAEGGTEGSAPGGNSKDSPGAEITPEGQRVNQDGSIDKRTAPEGGQSQATQEAQGNAAPQPQASAEDQATAAKLGERMEMRRRDDNLDDRRDRRETDNRQAYLRRASDAPDAIVLHTDHIHIAIPRGITREEVMDMSMKLMQFASAMNFEAELQMQRKPQNNGKQLEHAGGDRRHH